MEKVIRGETWEKDKKGFEQHMLEEDVVRMDWAAGRFEKDSMRCEPCGDKSAWDKVHRCCQGQCKGMLNALQHFPFAAWGDISSAPLDPVKVTVARRLEIQYAEKKPVWQKIQRSLVKERGLKIVKSRWIDINKGNDVNPNYRSRMVGNEFNNGEIEGLFAATPPLEALRLILSWAATSGTSPLGSVTKGQQRKSVMIADVSRAFSEAPAKRDVCVELP